jgi:hypothetical protein
VSIAAANGVTIGSFERRVRSIIPSRTLVVHFACNGERGEFTGRAEGFEISGRRWSIDLDGDAAFTVDHAGLRLRIHRQWFPFMGEREWVGNWCWNAYRMKRPQALRLLAVLAAAGWTCSGGDARVCDWFDRSLRAGAGS